MLEEIIARVLARVTEFSVATGDATDGSTTTLEDTSAVWEVDKWKDAVVEITDVSADKHYFVTITSNTADTLTFPAIAATVVAGDHYEIRMTLRLADIDKWGGTSLTGRDISLDLKALTDDSIKGILKSIGDIAALENLITRIGQTSDAMVAAGATGSLSAKLRRVTQGLEDLKTLITLAANSGVDIGDVDVLTVGDEPLTYSAPATVNVGATTTQILAANANRRYACIVNNSDAKIHLGIGANAVVNSGISINANGGKMEFIKGQNLTTQAINGIHASSGNKVVGVQEAE